MVCERPPAGNARVPFSDVKGGCSRFSRNNRPKDLLLNDINGVNGTSRSFENDCMGVAHTRYKKSPRTSSNYNCSPKKSPSAYSASPSRKASHQFPTEEKPLPSYIKIRNEPSKRISGFPNVPSNNVRRMRDSWITGQELKPNYEQCKSDYRAPFSPNNNNNDKRSGYRSAFRQNSPATPQSPKCESPYLSRKDPYIAPTDWASTLRGSSPSLSRSKGSNNSNNNSPSLLKSSKNSFFDHKSHQRSGVSESKPQCCYYDSERKINRDCREEEEDTLSSPCKRYSRGKSESPHPSPVGGRKVRSESQGRPSDRTKIRPPLRFDSKVSTNTSPGMNNQLPRTVPPRMSPPRASREPRKFSIKIRDANLLPESEYICFKEHEDEYKMILDMEEYVPGEIEVLQDDGVLRVKGRVKKNGVDVGDVRVKRFSRTFSIPKNSREEEIDSTLSNEGILTIYVPKKKERIIKIELLD